MGSVLSGLSLGFLLKLLYIYSLDVGNSDGSTAKEVLAVLFKGVPYEELVNAFQFLDPVTKLIPHQKLSPETATYWRNLATYLHSESEVKGVNSATTYFENFMPELTQFCNYVRQHFVKISSDDDKEKSRENADVEKELSWLFNGRQLIEMFPLFDLADVVRHLIQYINPNIKIITHCFPENK